MLNSTLAAGGPQTDFGVNVNHGAIASHHHPQLADGCGPDQRLVPIG